MCGIIENVNQREARIKIRCNFVDFQRFPENLWDLDYAFWLVLFIGRLNQVQLIKRINSMTFLIEVELNYFVSSLVDSPRPALGQREGLKGQALQSEIDCEMMYLDIGSTES
ncbi:hypothetical protein EVAR_7733_1 [Eumeta japonica]|uniref:Uncharacterized protein n=1 Tax=Eumeta variegata TaxID=151549 RepID=A0A4C1TM35_EUMVA|nr:hypothetical protein EVAR_7733_1 [Eumeta japonica]